MLDVCTPDVAVVVWIGAPTQRGAGRDRAHPTISVSQFGGNSQCPAGIEQLDERYQKVSSLPSISLAWPVVELLTSSPQYTYPTVLRPT